MSALAAHERFEMTVLDALRRARALDGVAFGGGTMLRLCHQLPRHSVDLDFFAVDPARDLGRDQRRMREAAADLGCEITDAAHKRFTWLLELRHREAPRRLKIELRKDDRRARRREIGIAFSPHAAELQVRLVVCSLEQMWENKIEALGARGEIRDAYDLDFLLRRGAGDFRGLARDELMRLRERLRGFSLRDFRSRLGALLPPAERERMAAGGLPLLQGAIEQALADGS